jgi:hypothetical protein
MSSEQSKREGEAPSGFAGGGGDASPYGRPMKVTAQRRKVKSRKVNAIKTNRPTSIVREKTADLTRD